MTVPTPNAANLYRTRDASDSSPRQANTLHQSMYVRQVFDGSTWEDSDGTQVIFGETYATNGATWIDFVPMDEFASPCTIELRGAKMPIKLIITDDLAAETEYEMGNSNTAQVIAPPPMDRTYTSARIIRRF